MTTQRNRSVCDCCCRCRRCARLSLLLRCPISEPFRTEMFTVYMRCCVLYAVYALSRSGILRLGLQPSASGVRPKESQRDGRSLAVAGRTTVHGNAHSSRRRPLTHSTQHMHKRG